MESAFYPVVTIETQEELDSISSFCDENKIEIQFLDDDLNKFPTQALLYIDKDDFDFFLSSFK